MKLACSSTAFDEVLRSGELTQLEWIDLCAHELQADGVVLDVRHFPRTDTDYLAQVKKMAVDLGLSVAAVRHDGFFGGEETHMEQMLEIALAVGAPLLSAPLPPETATSWSAVQVALSAAVAHAKRLNVTIALRNVPHTFAASTHDMKRVSKEADSAWLRYGPQFDAFDAGSEPEALLSKTVLAWHAADSADAATVVPMLRAYRGFLVLDASMGDARVSPAKNAFRDWRKAFCTLIAVDRT
jgi:hypothetical protein